MEPKLGEIAIARMVGRVDNPVYKIRAVLETGSDKGQEYLVGYKGHHPPCLEQRMIVRIDTPMKSAMGLIGNNIPLAGHFVTSKVPKWFDYAQSEDVILYGFWGEEQKERFSQIPQSTRVISPFYHPGLMLLSLHYSTDFGQPIPYKVTMTQGVEKSIDRNGTTRAPVKALYNYLNQVVRKDTTLPRIVTIDEHLDFEKQIMPAFAEIGLHPIEMELQR